MVSKNLARAVAALPLLMPGLAAALVVEIQGVRLEPDMAGASCVSIVGAYPGVRIEADRPGQTPRICHSAARVNSISLSNATLVATFPIKKEIVVKVEHEFPPGVNGKIMARAKLRGFFATGNGVGVPSGDRLVATAFFSQGNAKDVIGEPLDFTVGENMEDALFNYSVKEPYLAAGARALKGEMKITFTGLGHKVTFPDRCLISMDTGSRLEDKLETMEPVEDEEAAPTGEEGVSMPGGAEKSDTPGGNPRSPEAGSPPLMEPLPQAPAPHKP